MRLRHDPSNLRHAQHGAEFGRVAVLSGGSASGRERSKRSGHAVLAALRRREIDAHAFDPGERPLAQLQDERFERIWIGLHDAGVEGGAVQGALECMGLPYTGSGVIGSAIGMDRLRSKRLAEAVGVATGDSVVLADSQDLEPALVRLGLPLIVKPSTRGSSAGTTRVDRAEQLASAWRDALRFDPVVYAEAWLTGAEYTVAILQGQALPSFRIERLCDDTRYLCPSGLSTPAETHLANLALAACAACAVDGWGCVDFKMDRTGRPLLLEINTVPGMSDRSLVPMAAGVAGIGFDELAWRVLETSFRAGADDARP